MRNATFLYLKTGHNIFKPRVTADIPQIPSSPVVSLSSPADSDAIHIGPRGGKYRLDTRGRKIYLKAA